MHKTKNVEETKTRKCVEFWYTFKSEQNTIFVQEIYNGSTLKSCELI